MPELQQFMKTKNIDVCCIQETHLTSTRRFFVREYEVHRQDRRDRRKGGLVTLVKNTIPSVETQKSDRADLETEFLGVKLLLTDKELLIYNMYSPPDKQLQLNDIKPTNTDWILVGDLNSHSPSWGYDDLDLKGEELENWMITDRKSVVRERVSA